MHGKDVLHLCMHYFCFVCNVIHGSGALNYIYKIFHKCACCQNSYTFFFFLKEPGPKKEHTQLSGKQPLCWIYFLDS